MADDGRDWKDWSARIPLGPLAPSWIHWLSSIPMASLKGTIPRFHHEHAPHDSLCFQSFSRMLVDNLPQPLRSTLTHLRSTRNPVAIDVLGSILKQPPSPVRKAAIEILAKKSEESAGKHLAEAFHDLDDSDRRIASPSVAKLIHYLAELTRSTSVQHQRAAIAAICHIGIGSLHQSVLAIALDSRHPLAGETQQQILAWTERLGTAARNSGHSSPARIQWSESLYDAMQRAPSSIANWLGEALLACLHWEDSALRSLLVDTRNPTVQCLQPILLHSQRPALLDFLSGFLWQRNIPDWIKSTLCERHDLPLGIAISQRAAKHINANVRNHLSRMDNLPCLNAIRVNDDSIAADCRFGSYRLRAISEPAIRPILEAVNEFLTRNEPWADHAAVELLNYLPAGLQGRSKKGNGKDSNPSPPPSSHFDLLLALLKLFPHKGPKVQEAIRRLFAAFNIEDLMLHCEEWEESMMINAARIIQVIEPDWPIKMALEMNSASPRRRQRAITVLRFLGIPDSLVEGACSLLQDEYDEIRALAIYALVEAERREVVPLLPELAFDLSSDVQYAANDGLQRFQQLSQST